MGRPTKQEAGHIAGGCYLCEIERPADRAGDDTWDEACARCDAEFWGDPMYLIKIDDKDTNR